MPTTRLSLTSISSTQIIDHVSFDSIAALADYSGELEQPFMLPTYTGVSLGDLKHYDQYGDTTVEIKYRGFNPIYDPKPIPGQLLVWCYNEQFNYGRDYGFICDGSAGRDDYGFGIAITTAGVFIHDYNDEAKTYTPRYAHDYEKAYDIYPWSSPPPFGDLTEVWTLQSIRHLNEDDTATMTYTLTGSNHVGKTYTSGNITIKKNLDVKTLCIGYPWTPQSDFAECVIPGLEVTAARWFINNLSGVAPSAPVVTFPDDVNYAGYSHLGNVWYIPIEDVVSTNEPPGTVTGYCWSFTNKIPLPSLFADPIRGVPLVRNGMMVPGQIIYYTYAEVPAILGEHPVYVWAINDTYDVSDPTEISVWICDITLDGYSRCGGVYLGVEGQGLYRAGETAIVGGGVLGLVTPHINDTVTYTIHNQAADDELFEIVDGILKFKQAAVSRGEYQVSVRAEDEHGFVVWQMLRINEEPEA